MKFFSNFFNVFSSPTGSLVYLLLTLFSLVGLILIVFLGNFNRTRPQIKRAVFFQAILSGLFFALLLAYILSWINWLPGHAFLPPLERAIISVSIIFIAWLNIITEKNKTQRIIFISLLAGLTGLFFFTYIAWWNMPSTIPFNNTYLHWIWAGIDILLGAAAMVWILVKKPSRWIFNIGIFSLFILAGILELLGISAGLDEPDAFRWVLLIVFPLLFTNLRSLPPAVLDDSIPESKSPPPLPVQGIEITNVELSKAWAQLSSNRDDSKTPALIAKAVGFSLRSDITWFLSSKTEEFDISFLGGYNLIGGSEFPSLTISKEKLPIISNALKNQELIELTRDNSFSSDIQLICKSLRLVDAGHLLFLPMIKIENQLYGLLMMTPFSKKSWEKADLDFSNALINEIIPILLEYSRSVSIKDNAEALDGETDSSSIIRNLDNENRKLKAELELLHRQDIEKNNLVSSTYLPTTSFANEYGKSEQPVVDNGHLEMELRLTLEEIARLQNSLADANMRIHHLQSQVERPANSTDEVRAVIDSVVQELRQPMTSIIGYVDLFVSESAGSLNAMQKKFIDRVQASTERMQILMDDLIQTTNLQNNTLEINPEIVNVNEIIDQALLSVNGQLREKNISLRIDVPKKLAPITADKNSLKQILVRLLFNACTVTPNDQVIIFKVKMEGNPSNSSQSKFLRIQVTDSGGGIPPEELSNLFNRQYRAEKPLLKGIGDTGIGLTIAKHLVEAHGGNIWIESDPGKSSTINAMLPTKPPSVPET